MGQAQKRGLAHFRRLKMCLSPFRPAPAKSDSQDEDEMQIRKRPVIIALLLVLALGASCYFAFFYRAELTPGEVRLVADLARIGHVEDIVRMQLLFDPDLPRARRLLIAVTYANSRDSVFLSDAWVRMPQERWEIAKNDLRQGRAWNIPGWHISSDPDEPTYMGTWVTADTDTHYAYAIVDRNRTSGQCVYVILDLPPKSIPENVVEVVGRYPELLGVGQRVWNRSR